MSKFFLTTTLPYVNDRPHIGFALEIVQADALARFHRLIGDDVFFNFGTDEHGQKILRKAEEEGMTPQAYADKYAVTFQDLKKALNLSYDAFIRTTDPHHKTAAQEFWRRCAESGDIYKKAYKIRYCVGCELEKTDSELVDGKCPLHPKLDIETVEEENYFFKLSKYQDTLLALYNEHPDFVVPDFRLNEMRALIEGEGLQDFSISRLKSKLPWGVEVPGDPEQVMYVWFDALINYISTLGWPEDEKKFADFWGDISKPNAVQFAGKDQVRQQAAMWQAMLMSAGLPPSKQIFFHGFVSINGQKMSKSLGNVVYPVEFAEKYGTDAVRYYLLRHMHPFEDSDFSEDKFREAFNANLANGLGNVVARVMKLAEDHCGPTVHDEHAVHDGIRSALSKFEFNDAIGVVWAMVQALDERITREVPFKLIKSDPDKGKVLIEALKGDVYALGIQLAPFMPETSEKIIRAVLANKKPENLFTRLD
jgi:methionyl-tRNA synthetase